jgi:hypothetical protein
MSTNATEAAIAAEAAAKFALTANPGISFGSYILGMWLDAIMGGIMITQLITYFSHSRNERWLIRIIVVSFYAGCGADGGVGSPESPAWFSPSSTCLNVGLPSILVLDHHYFNRFHGVVGARSSVARWQNSLN